MVPCAGGGDGSLKWSWLESALGGTGEEAWKEHDKTSRQNVMMTSEPEFQEHKKLKPANNKIQSHTIPNVSHQTN